MLTSKEAQLGSLMARIAALGTIVVFAVQALLIGPDQVGYSTEYGAIVDIVSFVQTFGILFTISLTQKLFGDTIHTLGCQCNTICCCSNSTNRITVINR